MKTCPNCQTQYTDDTLRFCLQDGAVLNEAQAIHDQTVSFAGQETATVVRSEVPRSETVDRQRQSEFTRVSTANFKPGGNAKLAVAIAGVVLLLLVLATAGAVVIWLALRDPSGVATNSGNPNAANSANSANSVSNTVPSPTPSPTTTPKAANTDSNTWNSPIATPNVEVDTSEASREVSQQVYEWKSDAEAGDLDSQMQTYAPTVDYYRKRGASREFVRADRERAYRLFDSMSITVSNMDVTIDDSGETATALFDKEWVFEGSRRSTGKVRQELRFRKIDGEWLITGERDVKVYYTN